LRISEEEFWSYTPCKYYALLNVALEFKKMRHATDGDAEKNQQVQDGYIDEIPGW
jgi:hypothetical protein